MTAQEGTVTARKPHRATKPHPPVVAPPTPPYGLFWVVSLEAGGTLERRRAQEALLLAAFRASLTRQHRRAITEPDVHWVAARMKRGIRGDNGTPLVHELRVATPPETARYWILACTARTVTR